MSLNICICNRYSIFSKAAYAELKANTESVVTALHCKLTPRKFRLDVCCFQLFLCVLSYSFDSGANALEAAIAAVSKYGGASAGYRTLLDALIPALSALKEVYTAFP